MKPTTYQVSGPTSAGRNNERNVMQIIAYNPAQAICTWMRSNLPMSGPVRIVCKPVGRVAS